MQKRITLRLIPALIAVAFSGGAFASGFQLSEQSASGIGVANAGTAAAAEDASTVFFNPAGMTYLPEGHSISIATTILSRQTNFTNEGTSGTLNSAPYNKSIGDDGGNGGGTHAIPALYYSYALTPDWRLGFAINPTFADETDYDKMFTGRYSGLKTSIEVLNFNPSLAYKVNDKLSVALGINYAKASVNFKQATVLGAGAATADGTARLKGDGDGWGYNFGVMWQIQPETRLGFSYRSKIKFDLEGERIRTAYTTKSITADLTTPDTASLAIHHQLNDKWALLGDFTWTGWSSLQKLAPTYSDGSLAALLRYNFKDTYRVGLGTTYKLNDQWMLRAGTAYDKNPVPSDEYRTMTVPDADRIWLAFGAKWTITPKTSIDLGYAHVFVEDSKTARKVYSDTTETTVVQTVRGKFKNSADMLSLQLNYSF